MVERIFGCKGKSIRLVHTHPIEEVDCVAVQVSRVGDLGVTDGVKELLLVLSTEWGLTRDHLVAENAIRPPVHGERVPLTIDDLGGG